MSQAPQARQWPATALLLPTEVCPNPALLPLSDSPRTGVPRSDVQSELETGVHGAVGG